MMKTSKIFLALAAGSLLFSPAVADGHRNDFTMALEVGSLKLKDLCAATDISCADSEAAFGIDAGYWFNDFIALETGFRSADGYAQNYEDTYTGPGNQLMTADVKKTTDVTMILVGVNLRYPLKMISERAFVAGKTGLNFTKLHSTGESTRQASALAASSTTNDANIYYGVGAGLAFSENFEVHAGFTRYDYSDGKGDMIAGSVVYRF